MSLSLWRLIREVYTYDGARIWWTSRNRLLDGKRPIDADHNDVVCVLHGLAEGVM
ncbi:MAG: hypothetical protein V3U46_07335 [Acidimicrobiia bacterium]